MDRARKVDKEFVGRAAGFLECSKHSCRIISNYGPYAEVATAHDPNRIIHGPDGQRHFGVASKFAKARCDERIMDGQLVGPELTR